MPAIPSGREHPDRLLAAYPNYRPNDKACDYTKYYPNHFSSGGLITET